MANLTDTTCSLAGSIVPRKDRTFVKSVEFSKYIAKAVVHYTDELRHSGCAVNTEKRSLER